MLEYDTFWGPRDKLTVVFFLYHCFRSIYVILSEGHMINWRSSSFDTPALDFYWRHFNTQISRRVNKYLTDRTELCQRIIASVVLVKFAVTMSEMEAVSTSSLLCTAVISIAWRWPASSNNTVNTAVDVCSNEKQLRLPVRYWARCGFRGRVKTECDCTSAETRFGLPANRTSPFISAGVSVQSSIGSLGVRVKLKTAGYPIHSPFSPSLLLPCVAVCHQIPFPLYNLYCSIPVTLSA